MDKNSFRSMLQEQMCFWWEKGRRKKPMMVRRKKRCLTCSVHVYFIPHSLSLFLNVTFVAQMYHFCLNASSVRRHVPLQDVAQGFFFLDVCVSSIWCGGVGSSAVPCWCVAACVFCGGPSDLSQPLQHSPAKSNMRRERCSLPSTVTPAVILRNRHSILGAAVA